MAAIGEEEQFQKLCHFSLHNFLFRNILAVKNISGMKCGKDMWFSPVNCPRYCSSLSCDNNHHDHDKLGGRKLDFSSALQIL